MTPLAFIGCVALVVWAIVGVEAFRARRAAQTRRWS